MPTKPGKKLAPPNPVVRLYMAEDLRQEVNGKMSAIGLYPDNVVILRLPDDIPDPTDSKPLHFKSLCFLFNISELTQATTISIDLEVNGKRRQFVAPSEHPSPGPGRSINMVGIMEPCAVTHFGERKLIITIGELEHIFKYEIRRESISTTGDVPEQDTEMPKTRKRALLVGKKQLTKREPAR